MRGCWWYSNRCLRPTWALDRRPLVPNPVLGGCQTSAFWVPITAPFSLRPQHPHPHPTRAQACTYSTLPLPLPHAPLYRRAASLRSRRSLACWGMLTVSSPHSQIKMPRTEPDPEAASPPPLPPPPVPSPPPTPPTPGSAPAHVPTGHPGGYESGACSGTADPGPDDPGRTAARRMRHNDLGITLTQFGPPLSSLGGRGARGPHRAGAARCAVEKMGGVESHRVLSHPCAEWSS